MVVLLIIPVLNCETCRFVQEPLKDMLSQMDKREKELNDDVTSLGKKLTVRLLSFPISCKCKVEADRFSFIPINSTWRKKRHRHKLVSKNYSNIKKDNERAQKHQGGYSLFSRIERYTGKGLQLLVIKGTREDRTT